MAKKAKALGIGLLGFGTVGSALYELLSKRGRDISERFGVKFEVRRVLVKNINKKRKVEIPCGLLTTDFNRVLQDPRVDIVVEVMGGVDPAFGYISRALGKGLPVVTANKHLLAEKGEELEKIACGKGVPFRYEASVGAIIPILAALNGGVHPLDIVEVRGILNGTTNFILTSMFEEGMAYDVVLRQAQEKGFAEPAPYLDVSGRDSAHKLCVLSRLAFGKFLPLNKVVVKGIGPETERMVKKAKAAGRKVKLVGKLSLLGVPAGGLPKASVTPTEIVEDNPLFSCDGAYNTIELETKDTGTLCFSGSGAGGKETATAVMSDLLVIAKWRAGP